ncbi:hypothetical protein WJR50_31965 [Catalinimonas sp. 4WD22]|uniref:hypothetical protein n=1 Tax=Catalinimonas locisalis TaxID=3133978 RepID=UPI003101587D
MQYSHQKLTFVLIFSVLLVLSLIGVGMQAFRLPTLTEEYLPLQQESVGTQQESLPVQLLAQRQVELYRSSESYDKLAYEWARFGGVFTASKPHDWLIDGNKRTGTVYPLIHIPFRILQCCYRI